MDKILQILKANKTLQTIWNVLKLLWRKIIQFDIDFRAAGVAYNFTLAVFPTIIFLFTVIPYIPIKNLDLMILNFMEDAMPEGIYNEAKATIVDIISKKRTGVLSFGFIFAIFASTSGMMSLMRTFNVTYRTAENRGIIKQRLVAMFLNFLLTMILFLAILVLIVGRQLLDIGLERGWLNQDITYFMIELVRYFVLFMVLFIAVSLIYFIGPSIQNRWNFVNTGSITASILIIGSTNLFSYYLSNFATYNKLYGSIGTIIALMLWLYLVALILIVGFEINVSIDENKTLPKNQ